VIGSDFDMRTRLARLFRDAVVAGLCGMAAQWGLRWARGALGILPSLQPYEDLQRQLAEALGASPPAALQAAMPLLSGALIWSSIFAWAYRWIPGRSALTKGFAVTGFAWLLTGFVLLPLVGKGVFASRVDAGAWPAVMMLAMLSAYCLTLSVVYGRLRRGGAD
jgi:hypothetical protein